MHRKREGLLWGEEKNENLYPKGAILLGFVFGPAILWVQFANKSGRLRV